MDGLDWDKIDAAYREMDGDPTLPSYHTRCKPPVTEGKPKSDGLCVMCGRNVYPGLRAVNWLGCDGEYCGRWFHVPCLGPIEIPKSYEKWYCSMCDEDWLLGLSEWQEEQALKWWNENRYSNKNSEEHDDSDGGKKREILMKQIELLGMELEKKRKKLEASERNKESRVLGIESQIPGEDMNRKRQDEGRKEGQDNKQEENQQNRGITTEKQDGRQVRGGRNMVLGAEPHTRQDNENSKEMRGGEWGDVRQKGKTKNVTTENMSTNAAEKQAAEAEQRDVDAKGEKGGGRGGEGRAEPVATHRSARPGILIKVGNSAGPMWSCVRATWNGKGGG
ncbi:hypothetical protein GP486_004246 [Trichoglossum hirsutum]|uniref:PHD-type domain-containing protein n=1 Tax=Trichoglossum hirsutum TaxID=265104 RepID=A0A9P8LBG0_9PEZI|nr:hypothetical protein GP486_004246 [Trichoglossum hirsutum]